MNHEQHKQRSLERLRKQDETGLYALAPKIVEEIVTEVHRTLDSFFIPSDNSDEMLKHREKLHHKEGIEQITKKLVKQYGQIYKPIIQQEATAHVQEDMGYLPEESDYRDKHFWPKWQAKNEIIFNE